MTEGAVVNEEWYPLHLYHTYYKCALKKKKQQKLTKKCMLQDHVSFYL